MAKRMEGMGATKRVSGVSGETWSYQWGHDKNQPTQPETATTTTTKVSNVDQKQSPRPDAATTTRNSHQGHGQKQSPQPETDTTAKMEVAKHLECFLLPPFWLFRPIHYRAADGQCGTSVHSSTRASIHTNTDTTIGTSSDTSVDTNIATKDTFGNGMPKSRAQCFWNGISNSKSG